MDVMTLDLIDLDQKTTRVEVMITDDAVELRHRRQLIGRTDRTRLRAFLNSPFGEFFYGRARWIEHRDCVWLCIGNEIVQSLTDAQLGDLRNAV